MVQPKFNYEREDVATSPLFGAAASRIVLNLVHVRADSQIPRRAALLFRPCFLPKACPKL